MAPIRVSPAISRAIAGLPPPPLAPLAVARDAVRAVGGDGVATAAAGDPVSPAVAGRDPVGARAAGDPIAADDYVGLAVARQVAGG